MKTILLSITSLVLTLVTQAQTVVTDTVSIGTGYANQTWYSLQNGEQGTAPKNNWDLSFDVSGMGSSIYINSVTGTQLWLYPNGDTSAWSTMDTAGLTTWTPLYNSDTSWKYSAFDATMNTVDPFDVGWGVYSMITHSVIGDSLYIIKLSDNSYRKLWIQTLANGEYDFRFAHLDGTNDLSSNLVKANYTNKNFGYYSLQNNTAIDREPVDTLWDLLFTQYTAFIPQPYTVSGVLFNKGVTVAKADLIADVSTYTDWTSWSFSPLINEIGYNWKSFNGTGYDIRDSVVYFIQSEQGDIWKLLFTGFGGSANGNYIFTKEKLSTTGIASSTTTPAINMSLYPNPSTNGNVNLLYSIDRPASKVNVEIYDMTGKIVRGEELNSGEGFYNHNIFTSGLNTGLYIVKLTVNGKTIQQKLIVQ